MAYHKKANKRLVPLAQSNPRLKAKKPNRTAIYLLAAISIVSIPKIRTG